MKKVFELFYLSLMRISVSLVQLVLIALPAFVAFIVGFIASALFCDFVISIFPKINFIYGILGLFALGIILTGAIYYFSLNNLKKTIFYKRFMRYQGIV